MKKWWQILFILASNQLCAINYTWVGSDVFWTNANNWLPVGIPGGADVVSIGPATNAEPALQGNVSLAGFSASGNHQLVMNGFSLTINSAVSIVLTNFTINGGGTFVSSSSNYAFTNVNFNCDVTVVKTGVGVSYSSGCTFNGTTKITNGSTTTVRSGESGVPDIYNDDVTFNNNSGGAISIAHNSAGNVFNGNIWLNSTNGGTISFGLAGGTSTLASGFTIGEGITGMNRGTLDIRYFNQLGNTAQSIDMSWGGPWSASQLVLIIGPGAVFNGDVNFIASNLFVSGTTFNGNSTSLTKVINGGSLNSWSGGNIFNSANTLITNTTGLSEIRMGVITPDVFNGNVQFHRTTSSGTISPAYNGINNFYGNVTVSSSYTVGPGLPVTFGGGNGVAVFTGANPQAIYKPTAIMATPVFNRLQIAKAAGNLTLNSPINVSIWLDLQNGLINTSPANILTLLSLASTNIGGASSFVSGPMNCQVAAAGTTSLVFPVGKPGEWRPALLSVNHSDATLVTYMCEMIPSSADALGYTLPPTVSHVSLMRYWQIDRTNVSNLVNAIVTLYYDSNDGVTNYTALTVVKTIGAGTTWLDINGMATGNTTGSITSGGFNTFSRFTLGNLAGGTNTLPVEFKSISAVCLGDEVEITWTTASENNNDYFTIEFSGDAVMYAPIGVIPGAGSTSLTRNYSFIHRLPTFETGYYRVKQTDYNGNSSYSEIAVVNTAQCTEGKFGITGIKKDIGQMEVYFHTGGRDANLEIFSAEGRRLEFTALNAGETRYFVNTLSWANGIYWIRISNGTATETRPVEL